MTSWYNCYCLDEQNTRALWFHSRLHELYIRGQSALHKRTDVLAVRLGNGGTCGGRFTMLENTDVVGRFWKHVDKLSQNECWNWNADCYKSGYGRFYVDGKPKRAHRWIYQYLKGQLPKTIYVCHSCDNPRCVNPAHLFIGTQSDNMLDCSKKRRLYSQRHPEKSWLNSEQAKKLKPKGEEHGSAKLNNNDVLFIRQSNHISVAELATMFDVNPTTIRSVRVRKTWKHI